MTPDPQSGQDAKRIVLDFFDLAFVKREAAQAAERYLGTEYKQHNPLAPDGPEAFVSFVGTFVKQAPQMSFDLKRVIAEDDLVVLHYHLRMSPDDVGQAVVDIFLRRRRPDRRALGRVTAGPRRVGQQQRDVLRTRHRHPGSTEFRRER